MLSQYIYIYIYVFYLLIVKWLNSLIWLIDGILTDTLDKSIFWWNGSKRVLKIAQSCKTGALSPYGLLSYLGHSVVCSITPLQKCSRRILHLLGGCVCLPNSSATYRKWHKVIFKRSLTRVNSECSFFLTS